MLDSQMREEILDIIGFDTLRRWIIQVGTLGSLESAALLGDLLFDQLVNLSLKVVVLFVYDALLDLRMVSLPLRYHLVIQI